MFEEIEKYDKKLPNKKEIQKQFQNISKKYNIYQMIAVFVVVVGTVIGIIMRNHFSVCNSYSYVNNVCIAQSFNFGLMIVVWAIAFILGVLLSALGKMIELLNEIDQKLNNKQKNK